MEYARLQKENENLRKIIASAKEALGGIEIVNKDDEVINGQAQKKKKYGLTLECRDCLSGDSFFFDNPISRKIKIPLILLGVGMAVWNCGTFEMDCIKNTIELGSECYPCICEIIDFWWPDDAPNCFKKEIQKITVVNTENISKDDIKTEL